MQDARSENSVQFSLAELHRIEEERVREEETHRARSREQAAKERREAEARKRAEEEARIAAAEAAREKRARDEAAEQAIREARARAEIETARMQAAAKAQLEADNAARAHELAVLRAKSESGRRRTIYGLAVALGVVLCAGGAAAISSSQRMSALEADAARLRESQSSLSREHEQNRSAELGALDLRMAALVSRPSAKLATDAQKTAEAARSAVNPQAIDHSRLRAFADALDAFQSRIEAVERLGALDRRRESLEGWAVALRKEADDKVRGAASAAKSSLDDPSLNTYERALDRLQRDLESAGPRGGSGPITTSGGDRSNRPTCDPNVGDPMCDATGHRI